MITRNQVNDIVTQALKADAHDDSSASVFAQQLATALDALGLLQFCDISEPEEGVTVHQHIENTPTPGTEFFDKRDRRDPVT